MSKTTKMGIATSAFVVILSLSPTVGIPATIQHYSIDSSTSKVFDPLSIPRFQIAPLSTKHHVAFYSGGFAHKDAFQVTFNLDSTVRWVSRNQGALSDQNHSHISVYNDTIYQGRSNDSRMYAFAMTGDSLRQLFTHSWGLPESELYIASVLRLPGSDTVLAVTRGSDDNNAVLYWVSEDKGLTWGASHSLVAREGTGRCRIGALYFDNTIAAFIDSADVSIGWYTWDRANRRWNAEGRAFNRPMYRGFAGNVLKDTVRFLIGTLDKSTGDSVLWAYRNKGASQWTEGPAFKSSHVGQSLPPYTALTYITASKRLVLFYSQNDVADQNAWGIYMRYFDTLAWNWSAPTKVSRGKYAWKVTTAQTVPASHGDICYAMYPMDTTIGSTLYHFADVVRVTFSDTLIPPDTLMPPDPPANSQPVISHIVSPTVLENESIGFGYSATDADGTVPVLTNSALPNGATCSSSQATGRFDWTPTTGQAGQYNVTFYASDSLLSDSEKVIITVNSPSGSPDVISPAQLNPVTALSGPGGGQVRLNWTATGDDGFVGQAHHYQVRYGTFLINSESRWLRGTLLATPPLPPGSGGTVSCTISNLTVGLLYCFAVRAYDEAGNVSALSVPVTVLIPALSSPSGPTVTYMHNTNDFASIPQGDSTVFVWPELIASASDSYQFQLAENALFESPLVDTNLTVPTYTLMTAGDNDVPLAWRVRSGVEEWSQPMTVVVTDGCCNGSTGNVNQSVEETPDLSDLSYLIAYMTVVPSPALPCSKEANVNASLDGSPDLSDLTLLIAYLTVSHRPILPRCP